MLYLRVSSFRASWVGITLLLISPRALAQVQPPVAGSEMLRLPPPPPADPVERPAPAPPVPVSTGPTVSGVALEGATAASPDSVAEAATALQLVRAQARVERRARRELTSLVDVLDERAASDNATRGAVGRAWLMGAGVAAATSVIPVFFPASALGGVPIEFVIGTQLALAGTFALVGVLGMWGPSRFEALADRARVVDGTASDRLQRALSQWQTAAEGERSANRIRAIVFATLGGLLMAGSIPMYVDAANGGGMAGVFLPEAVVMSAIGGVMLPLAIAQLTVQGPLESSLRQFVRGRGLRQGTPGNGLQLALAPSAQSLRLTLAGTF
ncbi:MAG: hypothetical protein Q8Q09_07890 [Deltaproteobacteria bacterium]|nr:hypothetical protein [Deltaproteobacteria bacterium]